MSRPLFILILTAISSCLFANVAVGESKGGCDVRFISGAGVKLREKHKADSKVVAVLKFNSKVCVDQTPNLWAQVHILETGKNGWVKNDLLGVKEIKETEVIEKYDEAVSEIRLADAVMWAERAVDTNESTENLNRLRISVGKTNDLFRVGVIEEKIKLISHVGQSENNPMPNQHTEKVIDSNSQRFLKTAAIGRSGVVQIDGEMIKGQVQELVGPEKYKFLISCASSDGGICSGCSIDVVYKKNTSLKDFGTASCGGDGGDDFSSTLWIAYDADKKKYEIILRGVAFGEPELEISSEDSVKVKSIKVGSNDVVDQTISQSEEAAYKKKYAELGHANHK